MDIVAQVLCFILWRARVLSSGAQGPAILLWHFFYEKLQKVVVKP